MAKFKHSFSAKGILNMAEGLIHETKKVGKDEIVVDVDFFGFLKEFDGKDVTVSISENREVVTVDDTEDEEDEEEGEDAD